MARIRSIIADDELLARQLLRSMLEEHDDIEVIQECGNGSEVLAAIREGGVDLLFLDVEMPGINGLEVVDRLAADELPQIVFVTGFDRFTIRAFEIGAVDYLLKPFDEERLSRALTRIRRRRDTPDEGARALGQLLEQLGGSHRFRERLPVREENRTWFLPVEQIDWLEARGKRSQGHTGNKVVELRFGLSELEAFLDPRRFVRVNRSAIVRVDFIKEAHRWFKGEHLLVLRDGSSLHTGRAFRSGVENALGLRP